MTAHQQLLDAERRLTEARAQHKEKLEAWRALRPNFGEHFKAFTVASIGLASATDRVEELWEEFENAQSDAMREEFDELRNGAA